MCITSHWLRDAKFVLLLVSWHVSMWYTLWTHLLSIIMLKLLLYRTSILCFGNFIALKNRRIVVKRWEAGKMVCDPVMSAYYVVRLSVCVQARGRSSCLACRNCGLMAVSLLALHILPSPATAAVTMPAIAAPAFCLSCTFLLVICEWLKYGHKCINFFCTVFMSQEPDWGDKGVNVEYSRRLLHWSRLCKSRSLWPHLEATRWFLCRKISHLMYKWTYS